MQRDLIEKRLAGADGQPRTIYSDWVRSTLFANQSYAAILARDATVALCRAKPSVRVDDRDVDLTSACGVLAAWAGHDSLARPGRPLFSESWLDRECEPSGKRVYVRQKPGGRPHIQITNKLSQLTPH